MNAATRGIPVRFRRGAAGFEVKIKGSTHNRILGMETSLVQRAFDLTARADRINGMSALPLLRRGHVIALVTLPGPVLDRRRFEAHLKTGRKKRC